jgi:hypothetical protein
LGANFVPQSRDLAIPRERKPVEDFRRYVLDKPASTQNNAFQEVLVTLSQLFVSVQPLPIKASER